jgi:hypothetical protein
MARKAGQIVARGASTWLVRVYLGRDPQTGTRKYHNQTIHGPFREAQRFLNLKLQQRDNGRVSCAAIMSLNQLLDQWLTTVVKARVRVRTFRDYETLLRLHIRRVLGSRLIGTICQVDLQSLYAQMFERGLSARTIEYTNAVLESAFRHILLCDGPLLFRGLFYDLPDVRITKDHRPLGWYQGNLHVTVALHAGRCSKIVRETNPPRNRGTPQLIEQGGFKLLQKLPRRHYIILGNGFQEYNLGVVCADVLPDQWVVGLSRPRVCDACGAG